MSKKKGVLKTVRPNLAKVAQMVNVLNNTNVPPTMDALRALNDEGVAPTVTEIYIRSRQEQSIASQSLRFLRKFGMATSTKHGKHRRYTFDEEQYAKFERFAEHLEKQCDTWLSA